MGEQVDPRTSARKLLRSGLAENVVIPPDATVRVADRYAHLEGTTKTAAALEGLADALIQGKLLTWLMRHPIALGWRLRTAMLKALLLALFRSFVRHKDRPGESDESWAQQMAAEMRHLLKEIDEAVARSQLVIGTRGAIDARFHDPVYLLGEPFLRLELRGFEFSTSVLEDLETPYSEQAIATLLVHTSGVALLTISAPLPDKLDLAGAQRYAYGSAERYSSFLIPRTLIVHAAKNLGGSVDRIQGEWQEETVAGDKWLRATWAAAMSMEDVAILYLSAINRVLNGGGSALDDWHCYTSLMIDGFSCRCRNREKWLENHRRQLASAVGRLPYSDELSDAFCDRILNQDWSVSEDKSTFLTEGNSVVVRWEHTGQAGPDLVDYFWHLVLIDNALLQYWQLRRLSRIAAIPRLRERDVLIARKELSLGLIEYESGTIAYGTAQEMVDFLLERKQAHRIYQRAAERIDYLGQLLDTYRQRSAARRDILLTGAGSLTAILFGLPSIRQALDVFILGNSWVDTPQIIEDVPDKAALVIYGSLVLLLIFVTFLVAARSYWRTSLGGRRKTNRSPGRDWGRKPLSFELSSDRLGYDRVGDKDRG